MKIILYNFPDPKDIFFLIIVNLATISTLEANDFNFH